MTDKEIIDRYETAFEAAMKNDDREGMRKALHSMVLEGMGEDEEITDDDVNEYIAAFY